MRGVIKNVLAEELQNSLNMKKEYEKSLRELPQGCLVSRKMRGQRYYYLVRREGRKIKYIYKGKPSQGYIKEYEEAKRMRAKYRKLLSQVKKQIKFLKGTLRGKEAI